MILYTAVALGVMLGGYYLDDINGKTKPEHLLNIIAGILWPVALGTLATIALSKQVDELTETIVGKKGD